MRQRQPGAGRGGGQRVLLALRELDPEERGAVSQHGGGDRSADRPPQGGPAPAARGHHPGRHLDAHAAATGRAQVLLREDAIAHDKAFEDDREFQRKVRTLAGNYQVFARMPAVAEPAGQPVLAGDHVPQGAAAGLPVRPGGPVRLHRGGAGARADAGQGLEAGAVGRPGAGLCRGGLVGPRAGRIPGIARTFVVMHAASLVGLWRFLRGRQKVTWQLPANANQRPVELELRRSIGRQRTDQRTKVGQLQQEHVLGLAPSPVRARSGAAGRRPGSTADCLGPGVDRIEHRSGQELPAQHRVQVQVGPLEVLVGSPSPSPSPGEARGRSSARRMCGRVPTVSISRK